MIIKTLQTHWTMVCAMRCRPDDRNKNFGIRYVIAKKNTKTVDKIEQKALNYVGEYMEFSRQS